MLKFFSRLFDDNQKTIDKYGAMVERINGLEKKYEKMADEKLAAQTKIFKKKIGEEVGKGRAEAEVLDELLPDAFALVREAAKRTLGMRHFDVQLIAGIGLHTGMITEQRTGEGKTLTTTAPLYLNALLGKGVHLVTVNDYLAEVGAGWMGQIYHLLGLSTAVITHEAAHMFDPEFKSAERGDERLEHFRPISRREAYEADITYGTNNEFGFDYLRDNMVQSLERMVQREDFAHHFAIVDEADSILIDEARTPLIISAPDSKPTQKYYQFAKMVDSLVQDTDYKLDEKARTATLTDLGVKRIEQKLGVSNLYEESFDTIHFVENALKAKTLYHRDKEYIVREGQVIIVDEHTGRLMFGRRYSDGLHQSIEAKEGVQIQNESRTLATISLQNYFRLYTKLSGMTGTAATEAEEFRKIYNVEVLVVPTNKPMVREDFTDVVYKTTAAKYTAIVQEIEEVNAAHRPILLGTQSIEHNQIISNFLKKKGISHQVLNAKNNEKEAFIIASAGQKNAITIATNIAGRGVDIVLGGARPERADFKTQKQYEKAQKEWEKANEEVKELGGLHIIGAQRHESRRIDNQLRGRSGRQGDPGSSKFFVSLEDEIMRIFGGEQIAKLMDMLKMPENQPIEAGMVAKSIESAQVKVEGFFFDQRKRLVEFDDVMNQQRTIIYQRRRRLLNSASDWENNTLREEIMSYISAKIAMDTNRLWDTEDKKESLTLVINELVKIVPFDQPSQYRLAEQLEKFETAQEVVEEQLKVVEGAYGSKIKQMTPEVMRDVEKVIVLGSIDEKWMDHIDQMEDLREGIWLRGDKNTALAEYRKEAFGMFETLISNIEEAIITKIFRVQLMKAPPPPVAAVAKKDSINEGLTKEVADAALPEPAKNIEKARKTNTADFASALQGAAVPEKKKEGGVAKGKIGRNDPCYCGSGKKYKKCCMLRELA
ncbi:preprotein translocase subunit SecA [Microgenomates group bacterium]|nr:preprotein translocase subunit SecA [Microgenomates group bacterium]